MVYRAASNHVPARIALSVALACSILVASESEATDDRPNILFFLTDDQPQVCLGAMGNPRIQTPNMDRLADEGLLFTESFVTTSICCSNRACLLTGQHMRRHGIEDFRTPISAEAFADTYPALLRKAGYRTGYLGKFAIGNPSINARRLALPEDQFDFWYGFPQLINFKQVVDGEPRYLTDLMTEKAIQFLRDNPIDRPFCLTVSLKEPHGPWNYYDPDVPNAYEDAVFPRPATLTSEAYQALPDFIQSSLGGRGGPRMLGDPAVFQEHTRTFYRLVTRADLAIGQIMEAVRDSGQDDNTVVIFTSDNGDMQGAHALAGKWLMYEESIRVPLIIRDPRLPAELRGRRSSDMALSIDLAPTMLALAGVPIPAAMQGRDLTGLVRGQQTEWRDDWYYEHTYAQLPQHPIPKCEGVRTERWKYVRYTDFNPPREQLFDLAVDPGEENDLASKKEHTDMLARLRARCNEYRKTLGR